MKPKQFKKLKAELNKINDKVKDVPKEQQNEYRHFLIDQLRKQMKISYQIKTKLSISDYLNGFVGFLVMLFLAIISVGVPIIILWALYINLPILFWIIISICCFSISIKTLAEL